ncbi:MAG: RND family efflux transporter MFP subunit [Verrucomicrobiales bacterium]|jgi:RND family efflux transporter MFP subunit
MQLFFRALIPIGVLVLGWIGYSFLSVEKEEKRGPKPEPRIIKTKVIKLERQDFQTIVQTNGVVRPHHEASVTAQVSGKVQEIAPMLEDGAFFAQGDILLKLDDADFRGQVVTAEAQLARAKAAYSQEEAKAKQARLNWEDLGYDEEPNELVLRLPQLREADANVKAANATLDSAHRDLDRTQVRAPFDGRVLIRTVTIGQNISPGTSIATIFKTDFVEVRLPIPARQLAFLTLPESAVQPPVAVRIFDALNAESQAQWDGQIVGTEGALDVDSRELFAIARVIDPYSLHAPEGEELPPLRIGQPVRAEIAGKVLEDVFVVPRDAVRKLNRIYLVKEPEMELDRREIESIWADKESLIIRDETIADGSLVATSKMVYSPNASKVEVLPDGVDLADPELNDAATPVSSKSTTSTGGNKASAAKTDTTQSKNA